MGDLAGFQFLDACLLHNWSPWRMVKCDTQSFQAIGESLHGRMHEGVGLHDNAFVDMDASCLGYIVDNGTQHKGPANTGPCVE